MVIKGQRPDKGQVAYSWYWPTFHSGPDCVVQVNAVANGLFVTCVHCRVTMPIDHCADDLCFPEDRSHQEFELNSKTGKVEVVP